MVYGVLQYTKEHNKQAVFLGEQQGWDGKRRRWELVFKGVDGGGRHEAPSEWGRVFHLDSYLTSTLPNFLYLILRSNSFCVMKTTSPEKFIRFKT